MRDQAARGLVLSKMDQEGIILEGISNHIRLYVHELRQILNAVEFQKTRREEFADFLPLIKHAEWLGDHAYQPPGPDVEHRTVLYRDIDSIIKEKISVPDEGNVVYGYWNNQKVFRTERLENNLEVSVGRNALRLCRGEEGIHLRNNTITNHNQIEALEAAIQFTWDYFQHRDPEVW